MAPAVLNGLIEECFARAELPGPHRREPVRVWALSGVERVYLPAGASVILKYAAAPFTAEGRLLTHVAHHGVPVAQLLASAERSGLLAMLIEDLGYPLRDPTVEEAAAAAVAAHRVPPPPDVPTVDSSALGGLPKRCLATLAELTDAGRWTETIDVAEALGQLVDVAGTRAADAELAPFGLCHSEFHPTSLHVGASGWRLLDWARAFRGPGLLDLASWQNTTEAPDFDAFDALVDAYVAAGGPQAATADRGGLPVARWAYGWHRVWVIDWYLEQCTTWIADPEQDTRYQRTVRRHLAEAVVCLTTTS